MSGQRRITDPRALRPRRRADGRQLLRARGVARLRRERARCAHPPRRRRRRPSTASLRWSRRSRRRRRRARKRERRNRPRALRPRVQHPARQPWRRRGRRRAGTARCARRAVHRLGRARIGALDGQDPHQAGLARARVADTGLRPPRARRRRHRGRAQDRPAGHRQARLRRLERGRDPLLRRRRPAGGRGTRLALRRPDAGRAAHPGRRVHGRRAGHRGAALDPHRAGRRVLRLPRQVRRERHAVHLPGARGRRRAGARQPRAGRLLRGRLQRLGPGRLHARPRRAAVAARSEHRARA